jgi:hypothetical protein
MFEEGHVETRLSLFGAGKQEMKRDGGSVRAWAAFKDTDVPGTEAAAQRMSSSPGAPNFAFAPPASA